MQTDPKEILRQAAQLKVQINQLEAQYDELKPDIRTAVEALASEAEKMEVTVGDLGKFCRVKGKTKWTYSPTTQQKEKDLKEIKKSEEANGTATADQGFEIKFFDANKPKKEKTDDNGEK